jgi:hypothetical protein
MDTYALGNLVRVSAAFTNSVGAAVDPAVVKCQVRTPDGTVTTYTYGTDAEVIKSATGAYYLDVDAATAGEWRYRWYSTGSGQAADEGRFYVPTLFGGPTVDR